MQVFVPHELNDRYNEAFRRGSLEDLASLYESEATLSPQPGALVQGPQAIRERLAVLLSLQGELTANDERCVVSGDIALLSASWQFVGSSLSGQSIRLCGSSSKVARRQSDGSWKYVIDLPLGTPSTDSRTSRWATGGEAAP